PLLDPGPMGSPADRAGWRAGDPGGPLDRDRDREPASAEPLLDLRSDVWQRCRRRSHELGCALRNNLAQSSPHWPREVHGLSDEGYVLINGPVARRVLPVRPRLRPEGRSRAPRASRVRQNVSASEGAPIGAAHSIDQGSPPKRFATFPSLSDAKVANLGAAEGCFT